MNSQINIRTISACISVKDLEKSISWYSAVLRLKECYRKDYGAAKVAYLVNNIIRLELIENKDFIPDRRPDPPADHSRKQGVTHLTFSIEERLEDIENLLKENSIEVAFPITEASELGIKVMFIRDPDGNLIELNCSINPGKDNDLLIEAVKSNNTSKAADLLAGGANPGTKDNETGLTALMLASGMGNTEMVKELINAGASVFETDNRAGSTALHKACQGGSLEVVKLLVEAGAFIDAAVVTTGHTPLIEALWFKWPDIVEYLLVKGASLEVKTHYGFTLMGHFQYSLKVNNFGKEKLLKADELLKKRQQEDTDKVNSQKLMTAVIQNDLEAVKILIKEGADIEERYPVLGGFNDLHTPLLVACRMGYTAVAEELVKAGADINVTEPTFGAVPLHKATYNGLADVTKLLAEQPGIDLNFQGYTNGYTPLHDALWHGFVDCAEILINAGARLDLRGHDGKLPLDIAVDVFGRTSPIVKLIESKSH